MQLTTEQKRDLVENGFVHLPGVVPPDRVDAALRAINASMGDSGIPPEQLPIFRSQSYCREVQPQGVITDLVNATGVLEAAESAIGPGTISPVPMGQIALRFPTMGDPRPPHPHLDGMYTPTNGVREGTIGSFTALAGIMLSDVTSSSWGNFVVWPGTHRLNAEYFRAHGPESLLQGMPDVELPEPVQITGRAGDALLCHYLLSHGTASNAGPNIRYAVYFRLHHVDHEANKWEAMMDPWHEWAGIDPLATV